jgi:hypothetical protein
MTTPPEPRPFFARLLDEQQPEATEVGEPHKSPPEGASAPGRAPARDWTLKFPSDSDEGV